MYEENVSLKNRFLSSLNICIPRNRSIRCKYLSSFRIFSHVTTGKEGPVMRLMSVPHGRAALPQMARRLSSRVPTTQHDQQWCTCTCIRAVCVCVAHVRTLLFSGTSECVNLGRSLFWNVQPSRVRFTIGRSSLDNNSDDCDRVYRY